MNGPNILRLIVTLSVITFFRALYNFILSRLMISLRTSSQSLILQGGFAILCPTSRWSLALHLEFEGGVRLYSHCPTWATLYICPLCTSLYIGLSCTVFCVIQYIIFLSTMMIVILSWMHAKLASLDTHSSQKINKHENNSQELIETKMLEHINILCSN
jgi:hypothetical protein